MKKLTKYLVFFMCLVVYYFVDTRLHFSIPCPIRYVTGFQCPGCGMTRLMIHLMQFNIRVAFWDNPIIFINGPIILYDIIKMIYIDLKNLKRKKNTFEDGINILIVVELIIFTIYRNFALLQERLFYIFSLFKSLIK